MASIEIPQRTSLEQPETSTRRKWSLSRIQNKWPKAKAWAREKLTLTNTRALAQTQEVQSLQDAPRILVQDPQEAQLLRQQRAEMVWQRLPVENPILAQMAQNSMALRRELEQKPQNSQEAQEPTSASSAQIQVGEPLAQEQEIVEDGRASIQTLRTILGLLNSRQSRAEMAGDLLFLLNEYENQNPVLRANRLALPTYEEDANNRQNNS